MKNIPSNCDNIIDSRDIIKRLEELEGNREDLLADGESLDEWEDLEEYEALKSLDEEASGYSSDWRYGEALIADDYFTQYAEELAEDIGAIYRNAAWPLSHINWEDAAEELKQDYTSVDFGGNEYWIRSC